MTKTDVDACNRYNLSVTIKGLTNAQSYCVVDWFSVGDSVLAKLSPCHVDYHGGAVDVNSDEMITTNIYDLNMIHIEDYDNY